MKRVAYNELVNWKNTPDNQRKPLIVEGARQVGKTWLVREFGKNAFDYFIEINFEDQEQIQNLFEDNFDINRILLSIQAISGKVIEPGKTLIFFDEIQHARRGLLALKYFKDKAPQYHIIAAGSLLGVIDHQNDSFPVGKVDFLYLHPLSFEEFLSASSREGLVEILHTIDPTTINSFAPQYLDALKQYCFVGGMPEAVLAFVEQANYQAVRKVQLNILKSYEFDFSKHPPKEIVKRMQIIWKAIPNQLAKENKKFIYTAIRPGARARDFETSIQWLCDAGMVHQVTRTNKGEIPLSGFADPEIFKLYVLDIGLHGAMTGLDAQTLILGNDFFAQYKGALIEQFVLQELVLMPETQIHYWTPDTGTAEVDFVIQQHGDVIPIEVKAGRNIQAKSLKEYAKRNNPKHILRITPEPFHYGKSVTDLPLYATSLIPQLWGKNE